MPTDAAAAGAWSILTTPAALTTGDIAVALDADGRPHVAYSESISGGTRLRHGWISEAEMQSETVDSYGRGRRKWWVSKADDLQLMYNHLSFSIVGFHAVRRSSDTWDVESATFEEPSAAYTALWTRAGLVSARQIAVSELTDAGSIVRHGLYVDGHALPVAHTRLASEAIEPALAMAVDEEGAVEIAYSAPSSDPKYVASSDGLLPQVILLVRYDRGQWSTPEELTMTPGLYEGLSLAFDSKATLHVTYSELAAMPDAEYDPVPTFEVHHLARNRGVWTREEVSAAGKARLSRGSMAIGLEDDVQVAFCVVESEQPACSGVGYARRAEEEWTVETVESGCRRLGEDASIALGADGATYLAYRGCGQQLRLAHRL